MLTKSEWLTLVNTMENRDIASICMNGFWPENTKASFEKIEKVISGA